jgi:hypothetical protein
MICNTCDRIAAAVVTITVDMLHYTWIKTEYHMDVCRDTNATHIEVF